MKDKKSNILYIKETRKVRNLLYIFRAYRVVKQQNNRALYRSRDASLCLGSWSQRICMQTPQLLAAPLHRLSTCNATRILRLHMAECSLGIVVVKAQYYTGVDTTHLCLSVAYQTANHK